MTRLTQRDLKRLSPETRRQIRQALRSIPERSAPSAGAPLEVEESASKYHNVRTTVDGITFASQREANRYSVLCLELRVGEIEALELQKPFSLEVNGVHICDYIADFIYQKEGKLVVEGAKGKVTELFRLKKALMKAIHQVDVIEV